MIAQNNVPNQTINFQVINQAGQGEVKKPEQTQIAQNQTGINLIQELKSQHGTNSSYGSNQEQQQNQNNSYNSVADGQNTGYVLKS